MTESDPLRTSGCEANQDDHTMKIYGDVRSGNCDKVRFTVDYFRLPYEWVEIDSVAGATRTPEFLR